jgi:ethanolamine permease
MPSSSLPKSQYYPNTWQLVALGLLGGLSDVYVGWNRGLEAGLGTEIVINVIASLSLISYCCCVSELTSAFPCPGGSFGLTRCTVGFFGGFLGGCFELFYYILALGLTNSELVQFAVISFPSVQRYVKLVIILVFGSQVALCCSKRLFWWAVSLLTLGTLLVNCSFVVGALLYVDFDKWAYSSRSSANSTTTEIDFSLGAFHTGMPPQSGHNADSLFIATNGYDVMKVIPICFWVYTGTQIVNLVCDEVELPQKQIPFAQIVAVIVVVLFNVVVPIVACSMKPGTDALVDLYYPLVPGLAGIFRMNEDRANCLQFIGFYGLGLIVTNAMSKLLSAMAESRLLFPNWLARKWVHHPVCQLDGNGVYVYALLVGSALGLTALLVPMTFSKHSVRSWPNILAACALVRYLLLLIGYFVLRVQLTPTLPAVNLLARRTQPSPRADPFPRDFYSPFGIYGAVGSFVVFLVGLVAVLGFREESLTTAIVIASLGIAVSVYYFTVARYEQTYTESEKIIMLPVHAELLSINGSYLHYFAD